MTRPLILAAAVALTATPATAQGIRTTLGTLGPRDCARVTSAAPGYRFSGRVVHVVDGDTLDVARGVSTLPSTPPCIRVRLADFDAPEQGERGADIATRALRRITAGKVVSCVVTRGRNARDTVSHGRVLGRCRIGKIGLGDTLRAAGAPRGGK